MTGVQTCALPISAAVISYGAPLEKKEAVRLIRQAADMGYTFFDTAEVYGTSENPHENEELVAAALKECRDKVVIATKFGIHFVFDKTYDYRSVMPQFQAEAMEKNRELLKLLQDMAAEKHATPAQISMAWMLCKKPNEKAVGRAMKKSGLKREDIFLETKIWPSFYENEDAVEKTLERLDTDYIDAGVIIGTS